MNFKDLFKAIGETALTAIGFSNPLVAAAIPIINQFRPKGSQLLETASGQDVVLAVESMHPDQRASLMEKQVDLAIAQEEGWTKRYIAMTQADGQSSRAICALIMAWAVFIGVVGFLFLLGWEVIGGGGFSEIGKAAGAWTLIAGVIGIPAGILAKYFGELRKEQSNRQASVSGMSALIPKAFNPFNR